MLYQKYNYHVYKDFDTIKVMIMKMKLLLTTGILIVFMPILGFPRNIKNILLFIIGIFIIILTFSIKNGIRILKLRLKRIEDQQASMIQ